LQLRLGPAVGGQAQASEEELCLAQIQRDQAKGKKQGEQRKAEQRRRQ